MAGRDSETAVHVPRGRNNRDDYKRASQITGLNRPVFISDKSSASNNQQHI